jgi:hypothetical protein
VELDEKPDAARMVSNGDRTLAITKVAKGEFEFHRLMTDSELGDEVEVFSREEMDDRLKAISEHYRLKPIKSR